MPVGLQTAEASYETAEAARIANHDAWLQQIADQINSVAAHGGYYTKMDAVAVSTCADDLTNEGYEIDSEIDGQIQINWSNLGGGGGE